MNPQPRRTGIRRLQASEEVNVSLDRAMGTRRGSVRWGLVAGIGGGTLVYELALRALTGLDVAVWPHRHTGRDVALSLVVATGIAIAAVGSRPVRDHGVDRFSVSGLLMGAGWVWVAWGLVDQHVFHLFEIAPSSSHPLFWDLVFHGCGAVVGAIGWNLLDGARQREASTRTTAAGGNTL